MRLDRAPARDVDSTPDAPQTVRLIRINETRSEGCDGTRLRPLGRCELGGSCEVCWDRPDHARSR